MKKLSVVFIFFLVIASIMALMPNVSATSEASKQFQIKVVTIKGNTTISGTFKATGTYSGYAHTEWLFWKWQLWVVIDDSKHVWYAKWDACDPFGNQYFPAYSYLELNDDWGFRRTYYWIPRSGEHWETYYNTNTWAKTHVEWWYWLDPFDWFRITLDVQLYIGQFLYTYPRYGGGASRYGPFML
jgi:hypothetical protein